MKDFDKWNSLKKKIDKSHMNLVKDGEIWWACLGLNIGDEENGKNENSERPVLILKRFNNWFCTIVPLTSKAHENIFHHKLTSLEQESYVILSQSKSCSTKRMTRRITRIPNSERLLILDKIFNILK